MFDLQKFAGGDLDPVYGPIWVLGDFGDSVHKWCYFGDGAEFQTDGSCYDPILNEGGEEPLLIIAGLSSLNGNNGEMTGDNITVEGNAAAITVTADDISAVTVTGDNKTALKITIAQTQYSVNTSGKLYIPAVSQLPDFGLMTKADKQKLDDIADSCVTSGESTANGFVLKNRLGAVVITIPNMG